MALEPNFHSAIGSGLVLSLRIAGLHGAVGRGELVRPVRHLLNATDLYKSRSGKRRLYSLLSAQRLVQTASETQALLQQDLATFVNPRSQRVLRLMCNQVSVDLTDHHSQRQAIMVASRPALLHELQLRQLAPTNQLEERMRQLNLELCEAAIVAAVNTAEQLHELGACGLLSELDNILVADSSSMGILRYSSDLQRPIDPAHFGPGRLASNWESQ